MAVEDIDIYWLPGDPTWMSVPREYRDIYNFRQGRRFCDMRVFVSPSEKNLQALSRSIVTEQAYESRLKSCATSQGICVLCGDYLVTAAITLWQGDTGKAVAALVMCDTCESMSVWRMRSS